MAFRKTQTWSTPWQVMTRCGTSDVQKTETIQRIVSQRQSAPRQPFTPQTSPYNDSAMSDLSQRSTTRLMADPHQFLLGSPQLFMGQGNVPFAPNFWPGSNLQSEQQMPPQSSLIRADQQRLTMQRGRSPYNSQRLALEAPSTHSSPIPSYLPTGIASSPYLHSLGSSPSIPSQTSAGAASPTPLQPYGLSNLSTNQSLAGVPFPAHPHLPGHSSPALIQESDRIALTAGSQLLPSSNGIANNHISPYGSEHSIQKLTKTQQRAAGFDLQSANGPIHGQAPKMASHQAPKLSHTRQGNHNTFENQVAGTSTSKPPKVPTKDHAHSKSVVRHQAL